MRSLDIVFEPSPLLLETRAHGSRARQRSVYGPGDPLEVERVCRGIHVPPSQAAHGRRHGPRLVSACPCGSRMKHVATILDTASLQRLLRAKGLPHIAEPIRPARDPPQTELDFGA